jgi:hypothetical protein
MEFHTNNVKEERRYSVVLKNMHYSINPLEIKTEIENLGHTVATMWNIKQYRTKLPLFMLFVELKPVPNNKDIFNVEYIQQCKIKFKLPKHKCANCQRYGNTKIYCHLKQRSVKCAGDHSTSQCHLKERSRNVQCALCGGNHPANYKGCTVYEDLQKKTYPPLCLKQYTPPQPGVTYAQITKQNSYAPTYI